MKIYKNYDKIYLVGGDSLKLLLIEDNDLIIKAITYLLNEHNYLVDVAKTIESAKLLINNNYDLVILDVMLPDGNGLNFFQEYKNIPTLVLSAKDEEEDVVKAIDLGVYDYIIKPFRSKELLSRISNIIKRNKKSNFKYYKNIKFDMDNYKVFVDDKEIILTGLELKILFYLLENNNLLITRDMIIDRIWDASGKFVNDNTLSVYIKRIRRKIGCSDVIRTVKGVGYRIDL